MTDRALMPMLFHDVCGNPRLVPVGQIRQIKVYNGTSYVCLVNGEEIAAAGRDTFDELVKEYARALTADDPFGLSKASVK